MTVNAVLPMISFNPTTPAIYDSEDVRELGDLGPCLQGEHLSLLGKETTQRTSRTKLKAFGIFFASEFELKHHWKELGVGGQKQEWSPPPNLGPREGDFEEEEQVWHGLKPCLTFQGWFYVK